MPLLRYFFFVGGALAALLFIVNAALPSFPAAENPPSATADLSIIRIHSDRKWPERIVFDTTRPIATPDPVPAARIAETPEPQKRAAVQPQKTQTHEAFAQLRTNSNENRSAEPRRKRRSVARNYAGQAPNYFSPRPFAVAQQPRFGLFGNSVW